MRFIAEALTLHMSHKKKHLQSVVYGEIGECEEISIFRSHRKESD